MYRSIDRRRRTQMRRVGELVLQRSTVLDAGDRRLLEQVLEAGVTPRSLAAVTGQHPRRFQRRIVRLMTRLTDPAVLYILRQHGRWSPQLAAVALALHVRGWTMRKTAARTGLSLHHVRKHAATVRALIEQNAQRQAPVAKHKDHKDHEEHEEEYREFTFENELALCSS